MNYNNIIAGTFIKRINRFIAQVEINGQIESVHVKNTGRCKELFIEGQTCYLEISDNPSRKTKYSLITIYKGNMLVNIDSQVPNKVVYDAILSGQLPGFEDLEILKREYTYGNSRLDIYFKRKGGKEGFIEIKGVTLEREGYATFPDAPTIRVTKHVKELMQAVKEDYECYIFFLIQLRPVSHFEPNRLMDPDFSHALSKAHKSGVGILAYDSKVHTSGIELGSPIPIQKI